MVRQRSEPLQREPTAITAATMATTTTTAATATPTAIGSAQISIRIDARPVCGRWFGQFLPPSVRRLDASLSLKANLAVGRSLPQVALVTEFESFRSAFGVVHQSAFVEEAAPLTYWCPFGQLCATEGFDLMSDAVLEGLSDYKTAGLP
jgi:hypothetical protein